MYYAVIGLESLIPPKENGAKMTMYLYELHFMQLVCILIFKMYYAGCGTYIIQYRYRNI